jgi:GTP-binding protein HflX
LLLQRPATELRVPAGNGKLLAEIHRAGEVIDQRSDGEEMVLVARIDAVALARLQRAGAVVGAP